MSKSVEDLLQEVHAIFHELGNDVVNLANINRSDLIDNSGLQVLIKNFRAVYDETAERLNSPTLSIATLGTTSAGKSTIVNALIGRKVAPILNDEMSGGVLRLQVAKQSKLIIKGDESKNQNSKKKRRKSKKSGQKNQTTHPWEAGEWIDLSDGELYERLKFVMSSYLETRSTANCPAPDITVLGELLPANNRFLLGLPSGIDIEFVDLPGLKSVNDATNLRVIQSEFKKSCCLVALDYGQVDEKHRQALLKELRDVVYGIMGVSNIENSDQEAKIASIIFVLNKVDLRNSDDRPLDEQIEKLQKEIKKELSLKELPQIIPFSAQLLYYAQCAWGAGSLEKPSSINPQHRLEYLRSMFDDCIKIIKQKRRSSRELKSYFSDIEDNIENGEEIDDETMRKILQHAMEWSGGQQLWDTLRQRIDASFAELVLLPTLRPLLLSLDVLLSQVSLQIKNSIHEKSEEINKLLQDLNDRQSEISTLIKKTQRNTEGRVHETIESLNYTDLVMEQNEAIDNRKSVVNYKKLIASVAQVRDDLNCDVIIPVEDALGNSTAAHDLEDQLEENISSFHAKEIARAYDKVEKIQKDFSHRAESRCFYQKVKMNDKNACQQLEEAEKRYRNLCAVIRDALVKQAELSIQKQCESLIKTVQGFANEQSDDILSSITEIFPDLESVLRTEFEQVIQSNLPQLPEKFFDLSPQSIKTATQTKQEKVGQKTVQESYTKTVFFFFQVKKTRPVTKPVYEDIDYQELELPDNDAMVDQWREGIANGESAIWEVFREWIQNHLRNLNHEFTDATDRAINLSKNSIESRKRVKEYELEEFKQYWLTVEKRKEKLAQCQQRLQQLLLGE
ncbi:dynamin family protein [Spirulina major]|uniref:dynamin family protein n=1 Tax=Spirulina major TaxID=270636 RepID=UPI000932FC1C|nr:dynamin family protein [Spirulina major]